MGKIKLELDALVVESFDTGSAEGVGTVRGHNEEATLIIGGCPTPLCINGNKCATGILASCANTAEETCVAGNTCGIYQTCQGQETCGFGTCVVSYCFGDVDCGGTVTGDCATGPRRGCP